MGEQKGQQFAIAWLTEGKTEFCALDLFLEAGEAELSVKGKATVHLTGYFEADDDMDDEPVTKTGDAKEALKAKGSEVKTSPKVQAAETKSSPKVATKEAARKAVAESD